MDFSNYRHTRSELEHLRGWARWIAQQLAVQGDIRFKSLRRLHRRLLVSDVGIGCDGFDHPFDQSVSETGRP